MWKNHISKLNEEEIATWMSGATKLMELPIWIRDDAFDLAKIAAITRQVHRKQQTAHKADANQPELFLVVMDYAQLIRGRTTNKSTREQEVSSVSRTLRLLAMETNLAICVLSQLNKDGESRESKALEQDATAGWMIQFNEEDPKVRSLYIPWQRNGDSGALVNAAFLGDIARFENLSQKED
jgi:replicative DNA helicase